MHSHTTWSDGKDTLEEMARAAQAMGLTLPHRHRARQTAELRRRARATTSCKRAVGRDRRGEREGRRASRLLKGIESDILEDGALDYPDRLLEQLDVVIGSIHQRHRWTRMR